MQMLLGGDLKAVLRDWTRSLQPRSWATIKPFASCGGTEGKDHRAIFSRGPMFRSTKTNAIILIL